MRKTEQNYSAVAKSAYLSLCFIIPYFKNNQQGKATEEEHVYSKESG